MTTFITAEGGQLKQTVSGKVSEDLVNKTMQISNSAKKYTVEVRGSYIWIMAKNNGVSLAQLIKSINANPRVRNIRWKGNKFQVSNKSQGIFWPSRKGVYGSKGNRTDHSGWTIYRGITNR